MKKKITAALIAISVCIGFSVPSFTISAGAVSDFPRVLDEADLLSQSEEDSLLGKLDDISEEYECDVVVVTLDDLDGYYSAQSAADDIFDYQGYGYGSRDSGILLLISIEGGDWAISTYGKGIDVFTDKRLNHMKNEFKPYLKNNEFYDAFDCFADLCEDYLIKSENGSSAVGFSSLEWYFIPVSIAIGAIIALITAFAMRASLTSVRPQKSAASYVRPNSMKITNQRENFLYNNVTRVKIESSSSSGGSSTHHSSSGRSHGGASGKF